MQVYELMHELSRLPGGAEVACAWERTGDILKTTEHDIRRDPPRKIAKVEFIEKDMQVWLNF